MLQLQIIQRIPAGGPGRRRLTAAVGAVAVGAADRTQSPTVVGAEQRHRQRKKHFGTDVLGNIHLLLVSDFEKETDIVGDDPLFDRFETAAAGSGLSLIHI